MREQAFFNAGDKDTVKLQTLGRMYGHELHGILSGLGLVVARGERSVGQKSHQWA